MKEEAEKNGYVGKFAGWRIGGNTYDAEGNEIPEKHEDDCFCCRPNLLASLEE